MPADAHAPQPAAGAAHALSASCRRTSALTAASRSGVAAAPAPHRTAQGLQFVCQGGKLFFV